MASGPMSAVLHADVRHDRHGVVLRYPGHDVPGRHHIEQRHHASDRARIALIEAEKEFRVLALIAEHLDVSEHGRSRIYLGLSRIQCAHDLLRRECGLSEMAENAA